MVLTLQRKYQAFLPPGLVMIWISSKRKQGAGCRDNWNTIAGAYPALPTIGVDGTLRDSRTKAGIEESVNIFGLQFMVEITDYSTCYLKSRRFM